MIKSKRLAALIVLCLMAVIGSAIYVVARPGHGSAIRSTVTVEVPPSAIGRHDTKKDLEKAPLYPGAEKVGTESFPSVTHPLIHTIEYLTSASEEEVLNYYQDALLRQGWSPVVSGLYFASYEQLDKVGDMLSGLNLHVTTR